MDFRSDNVTGAHPAILQALVASNVGAASAYGEDETTRRLDELFSALFEREVAVVPVATGTAANALALSLYTPPWGAIYCHPHAHIQLSECGAPEAFTGGAKLVNVSPAADEERDRLNARSVSAAIHREGAVHAVQPAAVSISQATEVGTVYTPAQIRELASVAREHGMALHMDGARFANAVATANHSPAQLTWQAGVDVLSFGATKNGCLAAEAVILFDPSRLRELGFRRKRAGHLISKMRFLSAQLAAYLQDELWLANARWANRQAYELAEGLRKASIALCAPVETNQVFPAFDDALAGKLRSRGFQFYDWPTLGPGCRRLVTSFSTTSEDVAALVAAAARE